jgi:DNA-binding transcriptional LysR family regulator
MSRALARLRQVTGDPLLVRAGRDLVPTPRALELRGQVGPLLQQAEAVLRPAAALDPKQLVRRFTLRSSEGFAETFGPRLIATLADEAPAVRLDFVQKPDKDSTPLRDGSVDLETGVVGADMGPEVRTQALFRDRFVGVVRADHPLADGAVTPARYAAARHVVVSRRGRERGQIDDALAVLGLQRAVATVVGGFGTALALARATDLVASVPERHTEALRGGLHAFALPFDTAPLSICLLWHPRLDADPAHRWLRGRVRALCGGEAG